MSSRYEMKKTAWMLWGHKHRRRYWKCSVGIRNSKKLNNKAHLTAILCSSLVVEVQVRQSMISSFIYRQSWHQNTETMSRISTTSLPRKGSEKTRPSFRKIWAAWKVCRHKGATHTPVNCFALKKNNTVFYVFENIGVTEPQGRTVLLSNLNANLGRNSASVYSFFFILPTCECLEMCHLKFFIDLRKNSVSQNWPVLWCFWLYF